MFNECLNYCDNNGNSGDKVVQEIGPNGLIIVDGPNLCIQQCMRKLYEVNQCDVPNDNEVPEFGLFALAGLMAAVGFFIYKRR